MRIVPLLIALAVIYSAVLAAPVPENHRDLYIYNGRRSSNLVALTFDDGPNPNSTRSLLEALEALQCPATFYLLGEACERNPINTGRLCESDFELGHHSTTHANFRNISREEMGEELDGLTAILAEHGRTTPTFRPPYGSSNRAAVEVAYGERGMELVFWSLDTEDWKRDVTAEQIIERVLADTSGGEIILMHDRGTKALEVVRAIVPALRERGLEFVTVSEMLEDLRAHEEDEVEQEPVPEYGETASSENQS